MLYLLRSLLLFSWLFIGACATQTNPKRVVFFGDSITQAGAEPGGYITLMQGMVDTSRYELIGAGISGNKVTDLEQRLQTDVLDKNPDVVIIYIGINDVRHFFKFEGTTGTKPERYEAGLRNLAQRIKDTGATVVFCTPTVIGEDVDSDSEEDTRLAEYADIVRTFADDTGSPLCDLRAAGRPPLTKPTSVRTIRIKPTKASSPATACI